VHKNVDGENYEGEFRDGMKHGHGLLTALRWYYKGEFRLGKRNGKGEYRWTDGTNRLYEGGFDEDMFHGQGTYTDEFGNVYIGGYERGKKSGHGMLKMVKKGLVYEGSWSDGKKDGLGKLIQGEHVLLEGNWKHDEYLHI